MWWLPGFAALAVLAFIVVGAIAALIGAAPDIAAKTAILDPYTLRVTGFTVWQALLSTLVSLALAVPVARALARRRQFFGRSVILRLFSLSLVVPVIVAIFGIVAVHGRNGWVNFALEELGFSGGYYLYGLNGILIAHVFFNMPLAARIILHALEAQPPETWRLVSQLGMSPRDIFRLIEWPLMRQILPGIATLIFLLCFTSFAVVLTLGGGPRATTVEVAIYQALRFDFDIARAVALALIQITLCAAVAALLLRLGRPADTAPTENRPYERPDAARAATRLTDALAIAVALLIVALPLLAVVASGLNAKVFTVLGDPVLWRAVGQTLTIALFVGLTALLLGGGLVASSTALQCRFGRRRGAAAMQLAGSLILVVPPFVLAAGLFVLLRAWADVFSLGIYLVILVNACMALPFVVRILSGPALRLCAESERLCQSLDIRGWNRFRLIDWPRLRRPMGLAAAISATLSAGDLGVIALFGSQELRTLPLLLYQRLGSYRLDEAAVIAMVLAFLCLGLFFAVEGLFAGAGRVGAGR